MFAADLKVEFSQTVPDFSINWTILGGVREIAPGQFRARPVSTACAYRYGASAALTRTTVSVVNFAVKVT